MLKLPRVFLASIVVALALLVAGVSSGLFLGHNIIRPVAAGSFDDNQLSTASNAITNATSLATTDPVNATGGVGRKMLLISYGFNHEFAGSMTFDVTYDGASIYTMDYGVLSTDTQTFYNADLDVTETMVHGIAWVWDPPSVDAEVQIDINDNDNGAPSSVYIWATVLDNVDEDNTDPVIEYGSSLGDSDTMQHFFSQGSLSSNEASFGSVMYGNDGYASSNYGTNLQQWGMTPSGMNISYINGADPSEISDFNTGGSAPFSALGIIIGFESNIPQRLPVPLGVAPVGTSGLLTDNILDYQASAIAMHNQLVIEDIDTTGGTGRKLVMLMLQYTAPDVMSIDYGLTFDGNDWYADSNTYSVLNQNTSGDYQKRHFSEWMWDPIETTGDIVIDFTDEVVDASAYVVVIDNVLENGSDPVLESDYENYSNGSSEWMEAFFTNPLTSSQATIGSAVYESTVMSSQEMAAGGTLFQENLDISSFHVGYAQGPASTLSFHAGDNNPHPVSVIGHIVQFEQQAITLDLTDSQVGTWYNDGRIKGFATDLLGGYIVSVEYNIDGGAAVAIPAADGTYDEATEDFQIDFGPLPNLLMGYEITVTAENDNGDTTNEVFIMQPDNTLDSNTGIEPTCIVSNIVKPTSDTTPTYTGSCTVPGGEIDRVQYRVFNKYYPGTVEVPFTSIFDFTSGARGDETVEFTFTTPALADGSYDLTVRAYNPDWNATNENTVASDFMVIEAVDNTPPVLVLNPISPDPIGDTTPYITGTCADVARVDTNSTIATIQYRVDAGSWNAVPAFDGTYNSAVESYSYELPTPLSLAAHTVEVRCVDSAGNSTADNSTNASDTFTVATIVPDGAEIVSTTETFTSTANNAANVSTAIWGNGYARLRETMGVNKVLLDGDDVASQYEFVFDKEFGVFPGLNDTVWYFSNNAFHRYNPNDDSTVDYLFSNYNNIQDPGQIYELESGGVNYALIASGNGLHIINLDNNSGTVYSSGSYSGAITGFQVDTRSGRLGLYVATNLNNSAGIRSQLAYINTNNTLNTSADDTFTWVTDASEVYGLDSISEHLLIPDENKLLIGAQGVGLVTIIDNNTPNNLGDDTRSTFVAPAHLGSYGILGLAYDSATRSVFISNQYLSVPSVSVLSDPENTPTNHSDDEFTFLMTPTDIGLEFTSNIYYYPGKDFVPGQLFIMTSNGNLYYLSTNGTYHDISDDVAIKLDTSNNVSPLNLAGFYVYDYNTVYANFDRQGFHRLELDRGWEDTGSIISVANPPTNIEFIQNITLDEVVKYQAITATSGSDTVINTSSNAGLTYYISTDDGSTWIPTTIDVLQYLNDQDYRFKFRVDFAEQSSERTPVIDAVTLTFGAYEEEEQAEATVLEVQATPGAVNVEEDFDIVVEALDELGFPDQTVNGTATLTLLDEFMAPIPGLSETSVPMVNGVGIVPANISVAGVYYITAAISSLNGTSNDVNVLQTFTPSLNFSASDYTILLGETTTLNWSSSNLSSLTLSPGVGSVGTDGSFDVSPTQTTVYTLAGTGSYGDLTSTLTVTVTTPQGDNNGEPTTPGEGTDPTPGPLSLIVPITFYEVNQGEKVQISWFSENAESVFIDYLNGEASLQGSFEFFPVNNVTISITARRGEESITKEVIIVVKKDSSGIVSLPITEGGDKQNDSAASNVWLFLVGAAALSAGSSLLLAPLDQSIRLFGILFGFIVPRKRKYWGVVYDAVKLEGIPFAVVTLQNAAGEVVSKTTSDLEGRYGMIVEQSGSYTLEVEASSYNKVRRDIQVSEEVIADIGMYELQGVNVITKMLAQLRNNSGRWLISMLKWVLLVLMFAGFLYTLYVSTIDSSALNIVFLVIYLVLFTLNLISILAVLNKRAKVVNSRSGGAVKGAVVHFFTTEGGQIDVGISNSNGRLKQNLKPGVYEAIVQAPGFKELRTMVTVDRSGFLTSALALEPEVAGAQTSKFGL